MSKVNYGGNMILITTYYGNTNTFKLMPIVEECPYAEVIYDITTDLLVVISKHTRETFEMLPKLDEKGDIMNLNKPKANGKPFKEERRVVKLPQEYYLSDRDEQVNFIKAFAINADSFDFDKYFKKDQLIQGVETPVLVDGKGNELKVEK